MQRLPNSEQKNHSKLKLIRAGSVDRMNAELYTHNSLNVETK